jgi:hypothetical protein
MLIIARLLVVRIFLVLMNDARDISRALQDYCQ